MDERRVLKVGLLFDCSAPDDRELSPALSEAADLVVKDPDFREGRGPSGQAWSFDIEGTWVYVRRFYLNEIVDSPELQWVVCWHDGKTLRRKTMCSAGLFELADLISAEGIPLAQVVSINRVPEGQ